MARMALRPALRAYAHAPAGVAEAYKSSESMFFDGVDDKLATTDGWPGLASSGSGYTVSFWLKAVLPLLSHKRLFSISDTSGNFRIGARTSGTTGTVYMYEGNADTVSFSSLSATAYRAIPDALWHHYAFSSPGDGGSVIFYVDGVSNTTWAGKDIGGNLGAARLLVGSNYGGAGLIAGNFDEFAIFSAELNASAVTDLYSGGITDDLSAHANIQHWWRFESVLGDITGASAVVEDRKGSWDLDSAAGAPLLQADVPYLIAAKVSPYYGDATSGTDTITVTGSNLAGVSAISAGGNAFGSISASAGSVTASMVHNSTVDAVVDLVITDSTNNSAITLPNGFVYRSGSVPAWTNASSVELNGSSALSTSEAWPELASSGSGYTVSFWFKAVLPLLSYKRLFSISDISGNFRIGARTSGTTGTLAMYEGNADTVSFSSLYASPEPTSVITDADWHHYAFSSPGDGGTVTFYVDGVSNTTWAGKDIGGNLGAARLTIGSSYKGIGFISGHFDEFAIFGAELNASAVTALYSTGTPEDITAHADIDHYYRMGDSIGDTSTLIRDQVGGLDIDLTSGTPSLDTEVPS